MPFGNSSGSPVPEGRATIAQRFNAGLRPEGNPVPEQRQKSKGGTQCSVVPSGLAIGGGDVFPSVETLGYFHEVPSGQLNANSRKALLLAPIVLAVMRIGCEKKGGGWTRTIE